MSKILYFDDTKGFCQGVAAVKFENKWGAIDMKGNQMIVWAKTISIRL